MLATLRSAGDARRIRSPTIVCWRTNAHSRSSSGPGLWRISSGTASFPRSWSWAARSSSSSSSRRSPSICPDVGWPASRRRRAAPRAPARGSRAPRAAPPSFGRSLRGASTSAHRDARPPPAARWLASVASSGSRTAPNELPISKPSPCSVSASHARSISGSASPLADRRDEAELVATEPVHGACLAPGRWRASRRAARAARLPPGWPKRVVVALEAVEVEEHEERRRHGLAFETALEIGEELSAVRETCEGIGRRLRSGQLEEAAVLAERRRRVAR